MRVNVSHFFTDLEHDIQEALFTYWNDNLTQGQLNLILAPIHEKHKEYYMLLLNHKLNEFRRSARIGALLAYNARQKEAFKSENTKFVANENNLFGTLDSAEQKLAQNTFTASSFTINRVDENINQILSEGYASGKGINDVSRTLTERFDQLRTWESNRIARTEIHGAQNEGIIASYEMLGVEYTQWVAADDDRTRDTHLELDGEIIPLGGTYSNGLAFPGDTSGDIEEWINCRCSNAPFVMPHGMMAPDGMEQFREEDLVPIDSKTQNNEIEGLDSYALNEYEEQIYEELKPNEDKLGFLEKHQLEAFEDQIRFNELHNKFLKEGKLVVKDEFDTELLQKEYLKLQNKFKDSLNIKDPVEKYELEGIVKEPEKEYIDTKDLVQETHKDSEHYGEFYVDSEMEGFYHDKITDKVYYKGLEIKNYDFDYDMGFLKLKEIIHYNNHEVEYPASKGILEYESMEIPSLKDAEGILTETEYIQYDFLKQQFETLSEMYHDENGSGLSKKHALEIIDKHIEEFKELADKVETELKKVENTFSMEDMFELPLDDAGYLVVEDVDKITFNEATGEWEYKGVELSGYEEGDSVAYIDFEVAEKFIEDIEKGILPDVLTMEEILTLEVDPDGDYILDEDHKVTFNEITETWEYKGVELFEYDEYEGYGLIEKDVMQQYIEDNNLKPPEETFKHSLLEEIELDGQKYVTDPEGNKWVVDTQEVYEWKQDSAQHSNTLFTENQLKSGEFWGHYGHQPISNLIYANPEYDSRWTEYSEYMKKEVTPILNDMKDIYKKYAESEYDNIDYWHEYIKLEEKLAEVTEKVKDDAIGDNNIRDIIYDIANIDRIIIDSPELLQDTCLVRYGRFDESMCEIGGIFELNGFLSTSYDDVTKPPEAVSHFADKPYRWKIIVLAPEGTTGTRLNDQFHALTSEREWLLQRNQKFEVLDYGKIPDSNHPMGERNTVTIRLITD